MARVVRCVNEVKVLVPTDAVSKLASLETGPVQEIKAELTAEQEQLEGTSWLIT